MSESAATVLIVIGFVAIAWYSMRRKKSRSQAREQYRDEYYREHGEYPADDDYGDADDGGDDGGGDDGGGDD